MWWFYPGAGETAPAVAAAAPAPAPAQTDDSNFDFIEWVRSNESYPGLSQPKEEQKPDDIIVIRPDKASGTGEDSGNAAFGPGSGKHCRAAADFGRKYRKTGTKR